MSLVKQLWIAVAIILGFSFCASFVLSTVAAQKYFEQQLYLKNMDNAASLALSLSQVADDPVTVELLVSAQFNSGHYQYIRLVDPHGKVLVEYSNPSIFIGIPDWFQRLVPLRISEGTAQVQNGWKQYGSLFLQSHSKFAYESLWQEMLNLLCWFFGGAVLTCFLGTLALKSILHPLSAVVDQAEAIGARRFVTIAEPQTLELRSVVSAMNSLSIRVKHMFEEETARLEDLRRNIEHDPVTGLLLSEPFLKRTASVLSRDDASAAGALVIARFARLAEINRSLGRETTNQLLRRIGEQLTALSAEDSDWVVGRLSGSDFALLAPGNIATVDLAHAVANAVHLAIDDPGLCGERHIPVGATALDPGETLSQLLSRTDAALVDAERNGGGSVCIVAKDIQAQQITDLGAWRNALTKALDHDELKLGHYPVVNTNGKLLHFEAPVRLFIGQDWLSAGSVLPWVARLGLMPRLDAKVFEMALLKVADENVPLGINLSPEALCDKKFLSGLLNQLQKFPDLAASLWLEVPEVGAIRYVTEFRTLCGVLKPLGVKLGLEHVGHQFSRIRDLHDLGLDYIKIDASIVRDIHANPGSQAFLRGMCIIAHSIGLIAIAEGVQSDAEIECLTGLGMDGMTGPGVRLMAQDFAPAWFDPISSE